MIAMERERLAKGWSKRHLAQEAGIEANIVSYAENRGFKPYPTQAERLKGALGWEGNPDDLFREVGGE